MRLSETELRARVTNYGVDADLLGIDSKQLCALIRSLRKQLKRELADSNGRILALRQTVKSYDETDKQGDELHEAETQLAPGPCGKHRMCDLQRCVKEWPGAFLCDDRTNTGVYHFCLACEREADERKKAVQAALEKATAAALTERDIQPYEGGTFTRWDACDNVVIRLRALAAEGGGK